MYKKKSNFFIFFLYLHVYTKYHMKGLKDIIYPIRLNKKFKIKYLEFCEKNGFTMSSRVRWLMEQDMNRKKNE